MVSHKDYRWISSSSLMVNWIQVLMHKTRGGTFTHSFSSNAQWQRHSRWGFAKPTSQSCSQTGCDVRWRTKIQLSQHKQALKNKKKNKNINPPRCQENSFYVHRCYTEVRRLWQQHPLCGVCHPCSHPVIPSVTLQPPSVKFCQGPVLHSAPTLPLARSKIKLSNPSDVTLHHNTLNPTTVIS